MSRLVIIVCLILLLILAAIQAPSFLIVSDTPVKSDAVVLFLGGEKGTREKEANQIIAEGYADYLIIPAYRQIKKQGPNGKLIRIDADLKLNTLNLKPAAPTAASNTSHLKLKTASWLEDTHQEALIARDMMEQLGIGSAILVSSPYHMRRIKLIAANVFGLDSSSPPLKTQNTSLPLREGQREGEEKKDRYGFTLYCIPTRYEPPNNGFWLFNNYDRKFVLTEYMKIGWFLLYSPFV